MQPTCQEDIMDDRPLNNKRGPLEPSKGIPHQHDAEDLEELDASWHELDVEVQERPEPRTKPEHVEDDLWS